MTLTERIRRTGVLALLVGVVCCDTGPLEVQWTDGLSMLFIGNSITYWHDTPRIVAALADSDGVRVDSVASYTRGGWSLADHWPLGQAQQMIAAGGWDVVVLQGYSGIGEAGDSLLKYAELFAREASLVGARTALFMQNPGNSYRELVDEMAASYRFVAGRTNAIVLPVGLAWQEVWRRDPAFELYDDTVHPNEAGSYLAGLVIYQSLTGRSPIGLPASLWLDKDWYPEILEIPSTDAAFLQEVAAAVGERK